MDAKETKAIIELLKPKPPTLKEVAWTFVNSFVIFCLLAALVGYVGMLSWNNLTELTGLPEIGFIQGVNAFLVVRMTGAAFRGVSGNG